MNPSLNPAHASQTVDASLATRLDPVFQRFQFGGNYTTVEYPADSSAASLFNSLSRQLNHLFKMSNDETPNNAHNASGNIADNGRSGHCQPGPAGETASSDLDLASMLEQQHEMLLSCIQEISHLKQEKSAATQATQLRDSEGTQNFLMAASTSTTQQQMPPQTVAHPSGSYQHDQQAGQQRTSDENARRRNIDLNRWHVKFDGSGKGLTVESFVFRVGRLRQQHQISHEELFPEFHCLVTGQASKWYWQLLEDREGDVTFDYFALTAELLNQFKTADSDYELIREIMERKQQHAESFEDYYAEIHALTFRLRGKIPESEMIKIMKSNVKPSLATLISATKVESVGEFKPECKRGEKLLRETRSRPKHVSEIGQEGENGDGVHREAVEALAPRNSPSSDRQRGNGGAVKYDKRWVSTGNTNKNPNERHHMQPATSRAGQPKQDATVATATPQHHTTTPAPATAVGTAQCIAFCQSPFHLMMCYVCGMPTDFFLRNPAEGTRENRCRCPFHNMVCFACGKNEIYCALPATENTRLARQAGNPCQTRDYPEQQQP
uniref:Retrotransposon gag domain-containing protein n=1 Tax=Glossina palpalis gambiensis TaxID=67801 RepID=A0A1B0AKY8_9MUSC